MIRSLLVFTSAILFTSTALAYDFSAANALYSQRGSGIPQINAARAAFRTASANTTGNEKIYANDMLGKLAYYEGLITTDTNVQKRIFNDCLSDIESISSTAQKSPVYYYWKAVCLGSWGKANGILSSLSRSGELETLVLNGIKVRDTYEGGGFYRIYAALLSKLPFINPFGPRGDINKASTFIDKAIASPADPSAEDPSTSTGDYFFNTYEIKAEILISLNKKDEARNMLDEQIARIESGDIPVDREPETKEHVKTLKTLRATL